MFFLSFFLNLILLNSLIANHSLYIFFLNTEIYIKITHHIFTFNKFRHDINEQLPTIADCTNVRSVKNIRLSGNRMCNKIKLSYFIALGDYIHDSTSP